MLVFGTSLFLDHFLYFDYLNFPEVDELLVLLFLHWNLGMLPSFQLGATFFLPLELIFVLGWIYVHFKFIITYFLVILHPRWGSNSRLWDQKSYVLFQQSHLGAPCFRISWSWRLICFWKMCSNLYDSNLWSLGLCI